MSKLDRLREAVKEKLPPEGLKVFNNYCSDEQEFVIAIMYELGLLQES